MDELIFFFHSKITTNRHTKIHPRTTDLAVAGAAHSFVSSISHSCFLEDEDASILETSDCLRCRRRPANSTSGSFNKWCQHLCLELLTVTVFYGCVDSSFPLWPISTLAEPPRCCGFDSGRSGPAQPGTPTLTSAMQIQRCIKILGLITHLTVIHNFNWWNAASAYCRAITLRMLRKSCFPSAGKTKSLPSRWRLESTRGRGVGALTGSGPRVVIRNAPGISLCHANVQLFKAFAVVAYSNTSLLQKKSPRANTRKTLQACSLYGIMLVVSFFFWKCTLLFAYFVLKCLQMTCVCCLVFT